MPLKIRVDRNACRGSRSCVRRAPGSFSLDAEGKSVASEPPRDPEETVREAAASCPFFAIHVGETGPTS